MAELRNMAILVVVATAAGLLQSTEAKEHTVGGDIGWNTFPPGGASFYSKWAANFTFKVNDILVFNFESGSHTVAIISKANYTKCNVNENTPSLATGPARVTLNRTGKFYFACTFTGHCSNGQKLSVIVTAGSSSPVPAEAPAQGPSPHSPSGSSSTVPGAKAPPPQGSAAPLSATFSLLIITVAFNFLFHF